MNVLKAVRIFDQLLRHYEEAMTTLFYEENARPEFDVEQLQDELLRQRQDFFEALDIGSTYRRRSTRRLQPKRKKTHSEELSSFYKNLSQR